MARYRRFAPRGNDGLSAPVASAPGPFLYQNYAELIRLCGRGPTIWNMLVWRLCLAVMVSPYVGARSSLESHPVASDVIGSA